MRTWLLLQHRVPTGAESFDIPGARLSHHHGHSTFHTILDAYNLNDPVLRRLARIVDEADTVQEVSRESVALVLGLATDRRERAGRVVGLAALAALVTIVVDLLA